ncbi:hypothetical protein [Vitiosangium sp. GDMCC 1.1324]|uniref:hypothetical protein n=1 Tax=Vitiosangium sp. (strain GDMCC 1.1324) TaxID=2138576 RepID=UPI000D36B3E6|nr:hypothetical protein [Vitiosangium sp. GDMCC 1.1324]PTL83281.1 hypothetical protein DAT35_14935 [Vitiosangium sp. GDMCC 1.1324]
MNVRHLSITCVATLALATSACTSETTEECAEPLYAGKATDEAWHAMVDVKSKPIDSSRAVNLLSPTSGEVYPADATPPAWEWTSPLRASLMRPQQGALALEAAPRPSRSLTAWLGDLFIPTAHAHLPPYTGDLYWVEVSTPGSTCPVVQVLTSELSWQLDANTWAELGKNAGKDLTVQVMSAYLVQNRVTEGPYRLDPPRTFRRSAQ